MTVLVTTHYMDEQSNYRLAYHAIWQSDDQWHGAGSDPGSNLTTYRVSGKEWSFGRHLRDSPGRPGRSFRQNSHVSGRNTEALAAWPQNPPVPPMYGKSRSGSGRCLHFTHGAARTISSEHSE